MFCPWCRSYLKFGKMCNCTGNLEDVQSLFHFPDGLEKVTEKFEAIKKNHHLTNGYLGHSNSKIQHKNFQHDTLLESNSNFSTEINFQQSKDASSPKKALVTQSYRNGSDVFSGSANVQNRVCEAPKEKIVNCLFDSKETLKCDLCSSHDCQCLNRIKHFSLYKNSSNLSFKDVRTMKFKSSSFGNASRKKEIQQSENIHGKEESSSESLLYKETSLNEKEMQKENSLKEIGGKSAKDTVIEFSSSNKAATFSSASDADSGVQRKSHNKENMYFCKECGNDVNKHSILKPLQKTVTSVISFVCHKCDKSVSQAKTLKVHPCTDTGVKSFECCICFKRFSRQSGPTVHSRIHTGETLFECWICFKKFSRKDHLTVHFRIHTEDKPFECSICFKRFLRKDHLGDHFRTHTLDKRFKCSACNKRFSKKCHLTDHLRTHTGEEPFECSICSMRFKQKNNLITHLRTHTGERPFGCYLCTKKFSHKCNLLVHIRTHSKEKL